MIQPSEPFSTKFILIPDKGSFAQNHRTASTSIEWAIKIVYYPDIIANSPDKIPPWRWEMPYTLNPAGDVYMMVRDPMDRFMSALKRFNIIDIDEVLTALECNLKYKTNIISFIRTDGNFRKQSDWIKSGAIYHYYKFPDEIQKLGNDLQLGTIPKLNSSINSISSLTIEQQVRAKNYYQTDIELFNTFNNDQKS